MAGKDPGNVLSEQSAERRLKSSRRRASSTTPRAFASNRQGHHRKGRRIAQPALPLLCQQRRCDPGRARFLRQDSLRWCGSGTSPRVRRRRQGERSFPCVKMLRQGVFDFRAVPLSVANSETRASTRSSSLLTASPALARFLTEPHSRRVRPFTSGSITFTTFLSAREVGW